jgi:hypothetical protein
VRLAVGAAATTWALVGVALGLVLASITDPANTAAQGFAHLGWVALAVLVAVLVTSGTVSRARISTSPALPWIVGGTSFVASFLPWWGLAGGNTDVGVLIYRGLKVPQGIVQFWDLDLVMLSVDCARFGFDVYQDNNGCMQDASIYGPGMVWLRFIPFGLFSQANVAFLGVMMIVVSSLVLVWLARQAEGLGRLVLLTAAVGAPWLLLLERGNVDAVVLWVAAGTVLLTRRWNALWAWWIAAAAIWVVGTWKYYPFVLGVMLLPAVRLRRGWIVIAGFLVASFSFVLITWTNFQFSSSSNSEMIDYGDYVVLGRVPVVARMLGSTVPASSLQWGDVLLLALAFAAALWGFAIGVSSRRNRPDLGMLAVGGSSLYLASVLIAGFGYGYKAAFLLLVVPLASVLVIAKRRAFVFAGLTVVLLVAIESVVVWNTVLVTVAGLVAAGFGAGSGLAMIVRTLPWRTVTRQAAAA